jgi:aminopeptidase
VNAREQLLALPFDQELAPGARNAVEHCLRIRPEEKVTLITDLACRDIAAALAQELASQQLVFNAWILEDLAPRPLTDMPRAVLDDMETSQVSIFAGRPTNCARACR